MADDDAALAARYGGAAADNEDENLASQFGGQLVSSGKPNQQFLDTRKWNQEALDSAGNFVSGIASAIRHPIDTLKNVGQVAAGTVANMTPGNNPSASPLIQESQAKANAVGQYYKNRITHPLDTLYHDPVGALGDISMVAGAGSGLMRGVSRAASAANLPRAASVTGDIADVAQGASAYTNPINLATNLMPQAVSKAVPSSVRQRMGNRLYQSALKPSLSDASVEDLEKLSQTGINEGIPVSRGGLMQARAKISDIDAQAKGAVAQGAQQGMTVDPNLVAQRTSRARNKFANQVNPESDVATVDASTDEFLRSRGAKPGTPPGAPQPTGLYDQYGSPIMGPGTPGTPATPAQPIPVDEAQRLKTGTYAQIKADKYGKLSNAQIEAQKDLARGLKEEVYNQFPQLASLGPREGALIDLEDALDSFAARNANKDLARFPSWVAGMTGATIGGPETGMLSALAKAAIDNPYVKSRLAIAIGRSGMATGKIRGSILNPVSRVSTATESQP